MEPLLDTLTPAMFEHERVAAADDSHVLNALFSYAAANPRPGRVLDIRGSWRVFETVTIRATDETVLCGSITAAADLPLVVDVVARGSTFVGRLHVTGTGAVPYVNRGCRDLVHVLVGWRSTFDGFEVRNAKRYGVTAFSVIDCDLGHVVAFDCGSSGLAGHVSAVVYSFAAFDNEGASTSVGQYTTIHLGEPHDLAKGDVVLFEGRPYVVLDADEEDRVDVFPQFPPEATPGILESLHGGALHVTTGNTTGCRAERVSCQRVGTALRMGGLYGGSFGGITTDGCGLGLQIAQDPASAMLGGDVGHLHLENTRAHVVKVNRNRSDVHLGAMSVWTPERWHGLTTRVGNVGWSMLRGVTVPHNGATWGTEQASSPNNNTARQLSNTPDMNKGTIALDSPDLVVTWNEEANRLFGYDTIQVNLLGSTIAAPGQVSLVGDAFEGGTSALTFTSAEPVRLTLVRHVAGGYWRAFTSPLGVV